MKKKFTLPVMSIILFALFIGCFDMISTLTGGDSTPLSNNLAEDASFGTAGTVSLTGDTARRVAGDSEVIFIL